MIFRNINSFRALPTAEGVTHFAFDERDQAPFCGHGHSDCVCTSGGLGPPRDLPSVGLGHREIFRRCVQRYRGDAWVKDFGCHDQWLAMAFVQLTFRESLRDLESSLCSRSELLYQMGFRSHLRRSTLADANERRDWRIYADW